MMMVTMTLMTMVMVTMMITTMVMMTQIIILMVTMLICIFQDGRGPHKIPPRDHQHTAKRRFVLVIIMIAVIIVIVMTIAFNVIIVIVARHVQALLPDGQRAEAPDPGGGGRLPLRGLLRHRQDHLRLRLTHACPQPRPGDEYFLSKRMTSLNTVYVPIHIRLRHLIIMNLPNIL